jgi:hypothetical protein
MIANAKCFYFYGVGGLQVIRLFPVKGGNRRNKCLMLFSSIFRHGERQPVCASFLLYHPESQNEGLLPSMCTRLIVTLLLLLLLKILDGTFVIRNHLGIVVAGGASSYALMSALHVGAIDCFKGLEYAAVLGIRNIV